MPNNIDEMFDKFKQVTDQHLSIVVGLPLLSIKIAQISMRMRDMNIKCSTKEREDFMLNNLRAYSAELKESDNIAHLLIDDYIESYKKNGDNT